jgi:hypothetical protein
MRLDRWSWVLPLFIGCAPSDGATDDVAAQTTGTTTPSVADPTLVARIMTFDGEKPWSASTPSVVIARSMLN